MATQDITVTLTSVELGDVNSLTIRREVDEAGNTVGVIESVSYRVRESGGGTYKTTTMDVGLAPAVVTALQNHITNDVLPAINEHEGFV